MYSYGIIQWIQLYHVIYYVLDNLGMHIFVIDVSPQFRIKDFRKGNVAISQHEETKLRFKSALLHALLITVIYIKIKIE